MITNFINKYTNQAAYDADTNKQYPNTSLVGNDLVFVESEPAPADNSNVTITLNVPSTRNVTLFGYSTGLYDEPLDADTYLDYIKVDDVEISLSSLNDNKLSLASGTHTIKYKVKTPGNIGIFEGVGDGLATSAVFAEGFTGYQQGSYQDINMAEVIGEFRATSIDLPSTFTSMEARGDGTYLCGIYCTNLTMRYNGVVSLYEEIDCEEEDPETGDCIQELTNYYKPSYTNLYVPSAQVTAYSNASAGWTNVSAITE